MFFFFTLKKNKKRKDGQKISFSPYKLYLIKALLSRHDNGWSNEKFMNGGKRWRNSKIFFIETLFTYIHIFSRS